MGILDAIFGTNTTNSQTAATRQATGYQQTVHDSSEQALRGLTVDAQNALTGYGNQAIGAVNNGAAGALGALTSQGAAAQQQLAAGARNAVNTVQGSNAAYAPYQQAGQSALSMYANSLGLNGPGGNTAAQSAFQAGPGYQWQQDQATDAASRKAAALGMAGSGNTLDAITRLSSNLANQEYGQWQSGLAGLGNTGMQANNAVSANNQAAGGYQYSAGLAGGQLAQQLGSSLGTAYQNQGSQLGSLYSNLGSGMSNLNTNLANNVVSNNQWAVNGVNNANLALGQAKDAATNANNGIFSNLLGQGLGLGLKALAL